MPTGRLGALDLAAATDTTLYTVPASTVASVNVSLCNRGASPVSARVAIAAAATPTNAEYIEYDAVIPPNGVLERGGLALNATMRVVVRASAATVSAVCTGVEEAS
jgi:hypothetical protein